MLRVRSSEGKETKIFIAHRLMRLEPFAIEYAADTVVVFFFFVHMTVDPLLIGV